MTNSSPPATPASSSRFTMLSVESSQIAAVGYDPDNERLRVQFHPNKTQRAMSEPGSTYEYSRITDSVWRALIAAESKGSYFIATIKRHPDLFPYAKLDASGNPAL